MAFNEEEEELEFNSVFNDDDEDDEVYEEASEFDEYSEEEIQSKWGTFNFEELVFELETILGNSKKFFFSKKKRIVDAQEMANLTKLIVDRLPDEIERANGIIADRDSIIAIAKREADKIVSDANAYHENTIAQADERAAQIIAGAEAKARELVSEHSITRQAQQEGERIIGEAKEDARNIVENTKAACDNHIEKVMQWADENIDGVNEYVFGLLGSAKEAYKQGISSIDNVSAKYRGEFDRQAAALKNAPRIKKNN